MPELEPVQVEHMYFYYINDVAEVDLIVNVSDWYDAKRRALSAYRSQFEPGPDTVATPLNQRYVENVEARDRLLGGQRGWSHAEGFAAKRPVEVRLF